MNSQKMKMNTTKLHILLIFCLLMSIPKFNQGAKITKQPNIIVIMVDDMGWGDLGFQFQNQREKTNNRSEPAARTPNLDRLAAKGVQLPNHYCAAPVCAPSRASFILGQHQGHANVRNNQFDKAIEDNHTMATVLKAAGYSTASFGKWGLQGQPKDEVHWSAHPLRRGFDYYYGYMRHGDGHEHYPKEGVYRGKKEVYENFTNVADGLDKCYTADLWTAAAKRWIIQQKQGDEVQKPFFVFLAYDTPHAVLELPTQAYPEGGGLKGGLQWIGEPGHMINTASGTVDSWTHPDYTNATYDNDKNPQTPEVPWPDVYKRYATDTRRIDTAIGDLVQLLKDLKIDDNTLIVFTSDNGPSKESYLTEDYDPDFFNAFGPFDGIKRDVLEGGIRVAALAYWPGHFVEGKVVRTPNSSYDWLPTFAQLAGVPAPAVADGISLVPALTGKGKQPDSFVYVEYFEGGKTPAYQEFLPEHQGRKRNQMQMIIQDNFVGLRYNIQSHQDDFEIFDVLKDPQQANNLAKNQGMDIVQQKMKDKVLQSRRPNESAERPYDNEFVPAIPDLETEAGVDWESFTGNFLWVPDVSGLKPSAKGNCSLPSSASEAGKSQVLYFSGYLNIPEDGEYTFSIKSGNKAFFRIHDAVVIDADFNYQPGTETEGKVKLKSGLHPFKLYYYNKIQVKNELALEWSSASINKQPVPESAFRTKQKN